MNNEIINGLRIAASGPTDCGFDKAKINNTDMDTVLYNMENIVLNGCNFGLFILNLILFITTMKNIKANRLLCVISIIAMIINYIGTVTYSFDGSNNITYHILKVIAFIIQIFIFIKLIINIIKNNKKEEP